MKNKPTMTSENPCEKHFNIRTGGYCPVCLSAENTRLRELNREMVEALKAECKDCYMGVTERCGDCKIRIVLVKAEGES